MSVKREKFENLTEMMERQARDFGDRPAFLYQSVELSEDHSVETKKKTVSFRKFQEDVDGRRRELKRRFPGTGTEGIITDGSYGCIVEIFAANAAGFTVVMLEPTKDAAVMKARIDGTDVSLLWTLGSAMRIREDISAGVPDRFLFFTSGTTESAKAVILTGTSLAASADNGSDRLPLSPEDRLLSLLPLCHVFGFVCGLLWPFSCGACTALGRGRRHITDDFDYYRPTAVSLVPVLFHFLLSRRIFNEELRIMLIGAGGCQKEDIRSAQEAGFLVSFGYGLTETSSGIAISTSGDPFAMDVCMDDMVSIAEDGEILVEAPTCMMQGYFRDRAGTAAVLKNGVLHTGDLGYLDENGRLHITGRKKDMLVLKDGTKIFLPEYEARIAGALRGLDFACAGDEDGVVLYYDGDRTEEETEKAIRDLMDHFPIGRQVRRIVRCKGPLPRNAAGKVVRRKLQEYAASDDQQGEGTDADKGRNREEDSGNHSGRCAGNGEGGTDAGDKSENGDSH